MSENLRLRPLRIKTNNQNQGSWKLLTGLVITYSILMLITSHAFDSLPKPLPVNAPAGLFAEGRAMATTAHLARTIGHRQVSTPGEEAAAQFLLNESKKIAAFAAAHRPDLVVVAEREQVSGALGKQKVFGLEIGNAYNDLSNIILFIKPKNSKEKAVLVNAHYDSTLGSPGASDAASCVGVALEMARTIVYNASIPLHAPMVFLFNGGEETLMQASHGFMASSEYAKTLGAFINLESTGPYGPDVLFQHSGDWTIRAYSRMAPYPRGTTVGQDFFELGVIPADTDYRMFSYRQYGSVPGIDVAFLFDGTAYHTIRDQVERIRPGTLQAMGENMLATALEYARVLKFSDYNKEHHEESGEGGHVFFDIFAKYMVVYSHSTAVIVHQLPLIVLLVLSLHGELVPAPAVLLKHAGTAALSALLSILSPMLVGVLLVVVSGKPLTWYGHPSAAYWIYAPAGIAGLLAPFSFGGSSLKPVEASLGFALLLSAMATALTSIGMHSAYLFVAWSVAAIVAALLLRNKKSTSSWRWLDVLVLCCCMSTAITVSLPTAMSTASHIMEKIGLAGSTPGRLGAAIPDAAVGALTGIGVLLGGGAGVSYIVAALGHRKSKAAVLAMISGSLVVAAVAGFTAPSHPYSIKHPKRVIIQHFHPTTNGSLPFYAFSSLDAIPIDVALPESILHGMAEVEYRKEDWAALYPLNYLVTGVARRSSGSYNELSFDSSRLPRLKRISSAAEENGKEGGVFERIKSALFGGPSSLSSSSQQSTATTNEEINKNSTRYSFELDTVKPAWAVLNITGNIQSWSLGPEIASIDTKYHMVRYASGYNTHKWRFWVETPKNDSSLEINLFVKHLVVDSHDEILEQLPEWVSPAMVSTWHSKYEFPSSSS